MEILLTVVLIILGLALAPIARLWENRERRSLAGEWKRKAPLASDSGDKFMMAFAAQPSGTPPEPDPKGTRVLVIYGVIVGIAAIVTSVHYWETLRSLHADDFFFFGWLFLTMTFGMIVSVLLTKIREGRPLTEVTVVQLLVPMFFSLVVFYPIWAIASSSPRNFFAFYTAFLNGYFWDKIVASLKPPPGTQQGSGPSGDSQ